MSSTVKGDLSLSRSILLGGIEMSKIERSFAIEATSKATVSSSSQSRSSRAWRPASRGESRAFEGPARGAHLTRLRLSRTELAAGARCAETPPRRPWADEAQLRSRLAGGKPRAGHRQAGAAASRDAPRGAERRAGNPV